MRRDSRGHTLLELLVAIFIFSVVTGLISVSFNRIVSSSGQIIKSAETNMGGLIGLEVLRVDLSNAGLGLPWNLNGVTYSECTQNHTVDGIAETEATRFNDSPGNPPRAFVFLNNKGYNGSDYLVLKGSALGGSRNSRRWSYLAFGTHSAAVAKPSKSELELVPGKMDRVIVVNTGVRGGAPFRDLVTNDTSFLVTFDQATLLPGAFRPKGMDDRYLAYCIAAPKDPGDSNDMVTFPFNRADYFVGPQTAKVSSCSHRNGRGENRMGTLYRAQVSQKGKLVEDPILDCVADLQVVFMTNHSNDGTLVADTVEGYRAEELRADVREVRVYVLVQQGKKDSGYLYPVSDPNKAIVVGDPNKDITVNTSYGRVWKASEMADAFGDDWRNYHWQVYSIVVETKNLS